MCFYKFTNQWHASYIRSACTRSGSSTYSAALMLSSHPIDPTFRSTAALWDFIFWWNALNIQGSIRTQNKWLLFREREPFHLHHGFDPSEMSDMSLSTDCHLCVSHIHLHIGLKVPLCLNQESTSRVPGFVWTIESEWTAWFILCVCLSRAIRWTTLTFLTQ